VFLPFLKYIPTPKTIGPMDLLPASLERFPMLSLARRALELGGTAPCALNAANEVTVAAFLAGKLRFDQIEEAVTTMVEGHRLINNPDLIKLAQTDKRIREQTQALIEDWTL
jgi:1-deoxy-D-xylulose-5-phosphate reductoisomerase